MVNEFLNLQKMERRMRDMEELRFIQMRSIFPMDAMEDGAGVDDVHTTAPDEVAGGKAEQGDLFAGRDRYLWLRRRTEIPKAKTGLRPVGLFDFGKTGGGHNSGFESLLYVDGKPWQGVDSNHREVFFDKLAGAETELTFLLWTGLEGGGPRKVQEHRLQRAEVGYLHEATDELYYYAKAIVKTLAYLPEESADRRLLIEAMEAALLLLDWDGDRFHATVPQALETLKSRLSSAKKDGRITVSCVGHSHIDVAWLWRLKHTREKAIRSFATVLRLMEENEDYIFFQSQPQLYKYIKEDYPELYARIKARVAEGRWEPDGGMWLEADCNISSGESLVRQFLHGIRFFEQEFGRKATCLWLPDVFGYSWALPQIMRQCGIRSFVTTKISWNQYNSMPNDLFTWRGMDGSEVMAYFITTPEVGREFSDRFTTYNGQVSPRSVLGSWKKFRNKNLSNEVLIAFGYGDGGGGPNRNMIRMRQVMDELPGLPRVQSGRVGDFLARQRERVEKAEGSAPVWDGELYLEYHRGTYTSQARNKRWNRMLEHELAEGEMLSVMAMPKGLTYPVKALSEGWEALLRNQFHDIIPGSSIREVYEDSDKEYARVAALMERVRDDAFQKLVERGDGFTLLSTSSFPRRELVALPGDSNGYFACGGEVLPAQKCGSGYLVLVDLKPMSMKTIHFLPGPRREQSNPFHIKVTQGLAETPFYFIKWDRQGCLIRLYDKENQREVLAKDGFGNRLEVYEDRPIDHDNWDVDAFYTQKREPVIMSALPELVECGPLCAVIRFRFAYRRSTFEQDMVLYAHNRRIDFRTSAHWQENHRLMKTAFKTSLRVTKATYDIQYGHTERPSHANTSWDAARFEVVGHKWADLSESNYGVSLLNDCKYGYSANGGELRLTLLKSGKFPDTEADMGAHAFTYSLLPHTGNVVTGDTIEQAVALNLPVRVIRGEARAAQRPVYTDSDAVIVDAVKLAESGNGIIVRLHECRGGTHRVRLHTELPAASIQSCDLLEKSTGETYSPGNWVAEFSPFQLRTFRIELKQE